MTANCTSQSRLRLHDSTVSKGWGILWRTHKSIPISKATPNSLLQILNNVEWYAAFIRHAYDKSKAVVGEGYQVSSDSFDPRESSSSLVE